jgi:hypothetical protein
MSEVLWRHYVIGAGNFDIGVAVDCATCFLERWKSFDWQFLKCFSLNLLKIWVNLFMCGPVNPSISNRQFRVPEKLILLLQGRERPSFQGVLLNIIDSTLDLAFMPWRVGAVRKKDGAVVFPKRANLRVNLGGEPVCRFDCGLEVIQN